MTATGAAGLIEGLATRDPERGIAAVGPWLERPPRASAQRRTVPAAPRR